MYNIIYGFLYLFSLLPLSVLYIIADLLYFTLYHITRYRHDVVKQNIAQSFPNYTSAEQRVIMKEYYRHLCYTMVETFKLLSVSPEEIKSRFTLSTAGVFESLYNDYDSVIVLMGHMGNWEWYNHAMQLKMPCALSAIYLPVKSPWFNRLMYNLRTRTGSAMVNMNFILRHIIETRTQKRVYAFIADQTAPNNPTTRWLTFLYQDTPVYEGAEQLAKKFNTPVVYASMFRDKKGHFTGRLEIISLPPHTIDITQRFYTLLEHDIMQHPAQWLWSHRRWKHKRQA